MCTKLKTGKLTSVILVSGIPGSGKGRFAATLARTLNQEKVRATAFKMPTVQSSVKYTTDAFVSALIASASQEDVIVATLPSYHHLKKTIFELRKH
jgi:predicted PilT family ATPase